MPRGRTLRFAAVAGRWSGRWLRDMMLRGYAGVLTADMKWTDARRVGPNANSPVDLRANRTKSVGPVRSEEACV